MHFSEIDERIRGLEKQRALDPEINAYHSALVKAGRGQILQLVELVLLGSKDEKLDDYRVELNTIQQTVAEFNHVSMDEGENLGVNSFAQKPDSGVRKALGAIGKAVKSIFPNRLTG